MPGFDPVRDRALDAIIRMYRAGTLGGGGVTDGDKGDIVVSVGGTVWTLDAAVSAAFAPIAHVGAGGAAHANVVASGAAGFMTGADKAKLDAISGTNTGDQTTITGNAGSATILQASRNFSITGGGITAAAVGFNGSANVVLNASVDAASITNTKLANVSTATFKGRVTAGSGSPEDLTGTQATALLDVFGALKGLVPASLGGTTNFLRADGSWAAPGGGGGGTTINSGVTVIDFGAFPGSPDASVNITGQAGILAGSKVKAYLIATATADHSADEHFLESIAVMAGNIVPGAGFTIYAKNTNQLVEPPPQPTRMAGRAGVSRPDTTLGNGPRLYGQFTVAWEWV